MTSPLGLEQPTLDIIAAAYAAVVLERQHAFTAFKRGASDPEIPPAAAGAGSATFRIGGRDVRASQLGHVTADGRAWQWATGRTATSIPASNDPTPADAPLRALQSVGREQDIPELVHSSVALSAISDPGSGPAYTLVTAACGLLAARGYTQAPYDGGVTFLAILDYQVPLPTPDIDRLVPLMQDAISSYPHANRLTVETYLGVHGLGASAQGAYVLTEFPNGQQARFEFDPHDRLVGLEVAE